MDECQGDYFVQPAAEAAGRTDMHDLADTFCDALESELVRRNSIAERASR
jgi:hypothetical protein